MRMHYIQHVLLENPGSILTWAFENHHEVTQTLLYEEDYEFPIVSEIDWLIIMGGPMNVYEDDVYPYLTREKVFIKDCIESGKVVVGLCLGAQLIAAALGGKVSESPNTEIGWHSVTWTQDGVSDPMLNFFPAQTTVFQWHGDAFSELPEGAVLLAYGEGCFNQAFRYGDNTYAFQFHLENTSEMLLFLTREFASDLTEGGTYVQTKEQILESSELVKISNQYMNEFLTRLTDKFKSM
jgi:GMP synthase-like glutamine amidotransferase